MKLARTVAAVVAFVIGLALTIPAVLILLPFWATSALTATVRRWLEPRTASWREIVQYEPEVGWKPRANLKVHAADYNGDTYRVTTDPDGWRGKVRLDQADVVVFGDSFAFGDGVDNRHFFANLGGDVRIKAVGCPAYNMVQSLLWIERLAPRLRGKWVVWWVYLGNDLTDNLHPHFNEYRAPFVRSVNGTDAWEVTVRHVSTEPWPFPARPIATEAYIQACTPSHYSRRIFSACEHLIARGREICEAARARMIVMTIPELSGVARAVVARTLAKIGSAQAARFDEELPDRSLAEICARQRVEFVPLRRHLSVSDYRQDDFHWNERGHRRVAAILRELYRAHLQEEVSRTAERSQIARAGLSPAGTPNP